MKKRIDLLLVDMGYFESREQARRNIMAGNVFVDNQRIDKAGTAVRIDSEIKVKGKLIPYVSRGGLKLEKAISNFDLDLNGRVCMDIGASTGGFTDCMLQNNAKKVYSVDVGYGQLAWKLREDSRVVCLERQNIRYLDESILDPRPQFASIDVSFISLRLVLPKTWSILEKSGRVVALIKPQFEAGRDKVGKKGVVREKSTHIEVIDFVSKMAVGEGFRILDLDFSPIKGPEGNIEYLIYLEKIENKYKDLFPVLEEETKIKSIDIALETIGSTDGEDSFNKFLAENDSLPKYGNDFSIYYKEIEKIVEESHTIDS